MTARWRRVARSAALTIALAGVLVWCRPRQMVIELPDGYRGPVVIFFRHPAGETPGWSGLKRVYRVPKEGILRIRTGVSWRYWEEEWVFVAPDGKRAPIPSFGDRELADASIARAGLIQNETHNQGEHQWIQALVAVPADRETFHENPHFLVDRLKKEVERITAGKK
jgi:hypothetical protein